MTAVRGLGDRWQALPQPLRFLVVGGVNTLFGYGAYASLLFVGLSYPAAALIGTIAGVLFNFLTTGTMVFDGVSGRRLVPFVAVYVVGYALNVAALALLIGAGLDAYSAGLVCILPMAVVSYLLMRRFVFGRRTWR